MATKQLNRALASGGITPAGVPVEQPRDVCRVCGAPVRISTKYGWGTYRVYECGKISDDGPGSPCPNTPAVESVAEAAPVSTLQADAIALANSGTLPPTEVAEVAETFPVVLVEGLLQEVKTIPELSKADRLEAVLVHLEGFANMVVTKDDKKGADLAEKNRLLTKRIRVAASKICKDEREDAVEELKKIQGFWISTDRSIETRLKAVEEHLAAQVKVYTDEKDRIAKEAEVEKERVAAAKKVEDARVLQGKIQRLMDLGATPNMIQIMAATDEQFEAMVADAEKARDLRLEKQEADRVRSDLIQARTLEVARAGVPVWWETDDELVAMTADDFRGTLAEAIEKKALDAIEADKIQAEKDAKEERRQARIQRLENSGARSFFPAYETDINDMGDDEFERNLSIAVDTFEQQKARAELARVRTPKAAAVEWNIDSQWLGTASEAEFEAHLATATAAKTKRDDDAAELETLRKETQRRNEERETGRIALLEEIYPGWHGQLESYVREAYAKMSEPEFETVVNRCRTDKKDADDKTAAEAARIEAERPDREKVLAWLDRVEFEVVVTGPGKLESPTVRGWFDGHQATMIRAIQAAKMEFQP